MKNVLVITRLSTAIFIGMSVGIGAEATTSLEAQYIIKDFPGFLSILFFTTTILSCFQFLLSKISKKLTLWVPVVFDFITLPLIVLLFLSHQYFYLILTTSICEAIGSVFYLNRKNYIIDVIKNKCDMKHFFNWMASLFAIGQLAGYLISFSLIKLELISFINLYMLAFLVWSPTLLILIFENFYLKNKIK